MGNLDRAIRLLISIAVIALIQQQIIVGTIASLLVGAVILIITTTIFGICPLYSLINIDTNKKKNTQRH